MSQFTDDFLALERPGTAPSEFTVVALMKAYNEADIIEYSLKRLIGEGIDVYLFDNCSTDNTVELAERFLGRGLIGIERFPKEGRKGHNLYYELQHIEKYAKHSNADWLIHHDVDEFRESPWPEVSMRDALYYIDQKGYNCVDHTVVNFKMIDNDFIPGTDFVRYFRHWKFGRHPGFFVQIKTWKNTTEEVLLAPSGGHSVTFPSRKVYPYKFLLRHYQFRSEEQAFRKGNRDRGDGETGKITNSSGPNGYFGKKAVLIQDLSDLEVFDDTFYTKYLLERLTGQNII